MKHALLWIIKAYQRTLSPDHGWFRARYPHGYCRHYPSCSEYTYRAINRFGSIKGVWFGLLRVLRCNPFAKAGYDPIPEKQ